MPNRHLDDLLYRSERRATLQENILFIYTTCAQLVCVDCYSQRLLWKFTAPDGHVLSGNAELAGTIFVACNNGELYALSKESGKVLWNLSYGSGLAVPFSLGSAQNTSLSPRDNPWLQRSPKAEGFWRRLLDKVFGKPLPITAPNAEWEVALSQINGTNPNKDPYRSSHRPHQERSRSDARLFLFDSFGIKELSPFDGAVLRRKSLAWESPFVAANEETLFLLDLSETGFWVIDAVSWQEHWGRSFDSVSTRSPFWLVRDQILISTEQALQALSASAGHLSWRIELLVRDLVFDPEDPSLAWALADDDSLYSLDTRTGATALLATFPQSIGIALFQKQIIVYLPDAIEILDAMNGNYLRRIELAGEPTIHLSVQNGYIFLIRKDSQSVSLISLSLKENFAQWSIFL